MKRTVYLNFTLAFAMLAQSCSNFKSAELSLSKSSFDVTGTSFTHVPSLNEKMNVAFKEGNLALASKSLPLPADSQIAKSLVGSDISSANDLNPSQNGIISNYLSPNNTAKEPSVKLKQYVGDIVQIKKELNSVTRFSSELSGQRIINIGSQQTNPPTSTAPCTCSRLVIDTTIRSAAFIPGADPSETVAGVCRFQASGFGGTGGWHVTGDLTQFTCNGGPFNYVNQVIHATEPSPSCTVVSSRTEPAPAGRCTHPADTNYDLSVSSQELEAYNNYWLPSNTNSSTIPGSSQSCAQMFHLAFSLALIGINGGTNNPADFACYRLNFAAGFNSSCFEQLQTSFATLPNGSPNTINNLNHCVRQ